MELLWLSAGSEGGRMKSLWKPTFLTSAWMEMKWMEIAGDKITHQNHVIMNSNLSPMQEVRVAAEAYQT